MCPDQGQPRITSPTYIVEPTPTMLYTKTESLNPLAAEKIFEEYVSF